MRDKVSDSDKYCYRQAAVRLLPRAIASIAARLNSDAAGENHGSKAYPDAETF